MRRLHRLSSANIEIAPSPGSDPLSIVKFAKAKLKEKQYDNVYCVFDRDGHPGYIEALAAISRCDGLIAIRSVPCFEIWVLLHFVYSTAPFNISGSSSACDNVIRALKAYITDYEKGRETIFDELEPNMETAIRHAKVLAVHNKQTGGENPATDIHVLVDFLRKLKEH